MTELPECLCVKNGVKTFPSMLILLFSKIPQFRIRRAINFLLTDWNDLNHHMDIHFTVDYPFLFSFAFVVGLYIASHSSHLFKVFNHPYQNCFFLPINMIHRSLYHKFISDSIPPLRAFSLNFIVKSYIALHSSPLSNISNYGFCLNFSVACFERS